MKTKPRVYLVGNTDSSEFLKREFNWNVVDFDLESGNWQEEKKVILAFDFTKIEEVLHMILKHIEQQFILILLGNETQQMKLVKRLEKMERVVAIYSQYFPRPSILGGMRTCFIQLVESPKTFLNLNFFMICVRGAYRGLKSIAYANSTKVKHFPLGYSNRFVEELELRGIIYAENRSIMNLKIGLSSNYRKSQVVFKGQLTGQYRKIVAPYLMQKKLVKFELNQHWGRPDVLTNTSYVQSMIESKFVFCPPGHVSNDTFRRTEALICGALPIEIESSPQNWQKCNSSFSDALFNRYSIVRSLRDALRVTEADRNTIRLRLLNKLNNEILEVKVNIERQITIA